MQLVNHCISEDVVRNVSKMTCQKVHLLDPKCHLNSLNGRLGTETLKYKTNIGPSTRNRFNVAHGFKVLMWPSTLPSNLRTAGACYLLFFLLFFLFYLWLIWYFWFHFICILASTRFPFVTHWPSKFQYFFSHLLAFLSFYTISFI